MLAVSGARRGQSSPEDFRPPYNSPSSAGEVNTSDRPRRTARRGQPGHEATFGDFSDDYTRVVEGFREPLLRVARKVLCRRDLAEDALQEAFLALWHEHAMPPNPIGWLTRAVIHRCLHLNRTQNRRQGHEQRACCHRHEHVTDLVAREIDRREAEQWLDRALAEIPEDFRTVFVLREVEQMDYEAIASLLGIPLGTVRSRLNRSRRHLQAMYRRSDWYPTNAGGEDAPAASRKSIPELGSSRSSGNSASVVTRRARASSSTPSLSPAWR